jgi:hypothetical protein
MKSINKSDSKEAVLCNLSTGQKINFIKQTPYVRLEY